MAHRHRPERVQKSAEALVAHPPGERRSNGEADLEQPEDGELWDAVLTLPQHQRMALYLCYYQGYTAREAAEIMGKNPSTVRTWLVQGRKN